VGPTLERTGNLSNRPERAHLSPGPPGQALSRRLSQLKSPIALAMVVILAVGIFLRVYSSAGFSGLGVDEHAYMIFLKQIQRVGLVNYDAVVQVFVEKQYHRPDAIVPATRIGFLAPAYLCGKLFHLSDFEALRRTACAASISTLILCAWFGHRLGGASAMICLTALIATAPLQIYLAQRALIDGYFAFWAVACVWLAWENLQRPRHWGWLVAYVSCLAMLVLTKENGAFVVFALLGVFLLNPWLGLGKVTPHLLIATMLGPAIAVLFLAAMIGGVVEWARFYLMFEGKSRTNLYSVYAQDGPWFRYLVDFMLVSPLLVAFAMGAIFQLRKADRPTLFMATFLGLSFASMSVITYGMSLRYAAYWEIPLAWLACSQIQRLAGRFSKLRPTVTLGGLMLIVGLCNFYEYDRFFVQGAIYDPVTAQLAKASKLVK
jgi:4-amino-4-deoxy-L-arabinose transferase-like glycosyltransferase